MTNDHTLRSQDAAKVARPVLEWRGGSDPSADHTNVRR
jgi:hypothetical protein